MHVSAEGLSICHTGHQSQVFSVRLPYRGERYSMCDIGGLDAPDHTPCGSVRKVEIQDGFGDMYESILPAIAWRE